MSDETTSLYWYKRADEFLERAFEAPSFKTGEAALQLARTCIAAAERITMISKGSVDLS